MDEGFKQSFESVSSKIEALKDGVRKIGKGEALDMITEIGDYEVLYDTLEEPGTGTSRMDEMVVKIEKDGDVQYVKIGYFHLGDVSEVELMTKEEAEAFIAETSKHYEPYWEPAEKDGEGGE